MTRAVDPTRVLGLNTAVIYKQRSTFSTEARRACSDGSMYSSGSASLGFDPRRGSKF